MAEFVYATGHLAGDFTNPANAVGNTPSTWAGELNTNTSRTSRWAIGDPADPLTGGATQTIRVTARKGSNSNDPTIALNLYENGALVQSILAATTVTSTTGQTLTGTFPSSAVSDRAAVEIEVVMTAAGGSPSARNSAQVSRVEWEADTTAAAPSAFGGSTATVTASSEGAGRKQAPGASTSTVTASSEGAGSKDARGGAEALVTVTATGAGAGGGAAGGSTANITVAGQGAGAKSVTAGGQATMTATATGSGLKAAMAGQSANIAVTAEAGGSSHRIGGSAAIIQVRAEASSSGGSGTSMHRKRTASAGFLLQTGGA